MSIEQICYTPLDIQLKVTPSDDTKAALVPLLCAKQPLPDLRQRLGNHGYRLVTSTQWKTDKTEAIIPEILAWESIRSEDCKIETAEAIVMLLIFVDNERIAGVLTAHEEIHQK